MTREDIAKIIKESRIAAGLTQLQVAEALGRPQNTVSAWEMGRAQPDANTLFDLFRVLGRSVDEAFGFEKSTTQLSSEAKKIAQDYDTLDDDRKQMVRETVKMAMEIQASMNRYIANVRVLRLYDYYLNFDNLEESGIDLDVDRPCENPFFIPDNPPKNQAEVLKKLKNREFTQPIGIHFRHDGQYDKVYIVDLGKQAEPGTLGLYSIKGRSFLAKIRAGKLFFHPYNRNPVAIPEYIKCDGAAVGFIGAKFIYR